MKKILFVIPEHTHGGTNKSLQNLMSLLDPFKYELYVYCIFRGGFYEKVFAERAISQGIFLRFATGRNLLTRVFWKIDKLLVYRLSDFIFSYECRRISKEKKYDIIIAFQEGITTRFTSHFKGSRLIAWVQCDYSLYYKGLQHSFSIEQKKYVKYSNIVCVSACTAIVMQSYFPTLKDRIHFAYNTLNIEETIKLSQETIKDDRFDNSCFTIVSIGRFSRVKRFTYIPKIASVILKNDPNIKFKWYIIADGNGEKEQTEEQIRKYDVQNNVILLGSQNNPYPFIKLSDLLVCLSVVESWSYVLNEAILLHVPVLSTDFDAAYEVVDERIGIITNIDKMPYVLNQLINDTERTYSRLKEGVTKYEYTNDEAIQKVENIIQGECT